MLVQKKAEQNERSATMSLNKDSRMRDSDLSPRREFEGEYHPAAHGRHPEHRSSSGPLSALGLYLLVVLLVLLAGPLLLGPFGMQGIILLQTTCLIVPSLLYIRLTQGEVIRVLSLRGSDIRVVLGAAILGCSLWYVLLHVIMPIQEALLPVPETFMSEREKFFDSPDTLMGWASLWVAAALTPAICEEILFRGVMLHGMRTRFTGWHAVLVVSVLFSFFHFNPYQLSVTFIQGVVMGWLLVRSRSILSSIVFHLFNNSAVLAMSRGAEPLFPEWLPVMMLVACLMGLMMVWYYTDGALFTHEDPDT